MEYISLVTTALEYYDTNNETYSNTFKNVNYTTFVKANNDMEHNMIIFYDKNKKELFRSKYEIIGLHNTDSNTWTWGWAIPNFKKNNTNIIRRLWNYGATLDPNAKHLKSELITSRFRVANDAQLDIHISMASYLSKTPLIYKHYHTSHQHSDADGYLNINVDKTGQQYTTYFMFLLDYKSIVANQ